MPAAVLVITSSPPVLAVTAAVTCPALLVIPEAGSNTMVLPVCEVTVTLTPGTATPAESLTLMISVVVAPNASELLPLIVIAVPVTSTLLDATALSAVAEIAIVRFALLLPKLSLAVAIPLASVVVARLVK